MKAMTERLVRDLGRDLQLCDRARYDLGQLAKQIEDLPDDEARARVHAFADRAVDRTLGGAALMLALGLREERFLESLPSDTERSRYVERLETVGNVGRGFDVPEAEE